MEGIYGALPAGAGSASAQRLGTGGVGPGKGERDHRRNPASEQCDPAGGGADDQRRPRVKRTARYKACLSFCVEMAELECVPDPLEGIVRRTILYQPSGRRRVCAVNSERSEELRRGGFAAPRALQLPEGGATKGSKTQNKKQLRKQLLFVLVETTELESVTFRV